jgi:tetratricopeptide (TPR) repeat protein
MSHAGRARVTGLVSSALDLDPAEREAFLSRECEGQPELRLEVEALLLEAGLSAEPPANLPGGWRLFDRIGDGDPPVFRAMRTLAGGPQLGAARIFQGAAGAPPYFPRLQHPNIAGVIDAGVTDGGSPFLVTELVDKAQPFVEYCLTLPPRDRLRLFVKLCGAAQHAHRHLVAFGNLKPSKVLVTREGEPKLLGPGVGGASTAVDIEALGALLFDIAKDAGADVDAIVLKATAGELDRRYATVEQLAADIQRRIDGLPVLAREQNWRYTAVKWIARHKGLTLLAGALAAVGAFVVWQAAGLARQRDLAEDQLRETREIAGSMAMLVPGHIAAVQAALPMRRKMIQFGLAYLDNLHDNRDPADRKQRRQLALAYFEVANALGGPNAANVGDYDGAARCYRKAIELLWEDSASLPRDKAVLEAMRLSHGRLLVDLRRLRRLNEALEVSEKCIVLAPQIDRDTSDAVALGCRFQRLQILAAMGRPLSDGETEAVLKASLDHADAAEYAVSAINAELRLANLYLAQKDYPNAIAHARGGLDTALKNRNPEVSVAKARLMVVASLAEYRSGAQDAARQRFEECFDLLRELVRREPGDVDSRTELARALFESLETIPDDTGLHHARMVEAESLAQAIVKDSDYPEGRFLLVRILARQGELQNNDCGLRQKSLDEYQKLIAAGLALPSDKAVVDEIRNRTCGGGH